MKRWIALLMAVFMLMLAACGPGGGEEPAADEPSPDPRESVQPLESNEPPVESAVVNPLTGLPIDERYVNTRPYAIMLNNLKQALPQLGNASADIIYEVLAEGGITRMLGVYQSVEGVGTIGSIRSSRPYYLELALGHDAIYLHAGGSEEAYSAITAWQVTALDCIRGPHMGTIFWRDQARVRNNGSEHSVVTTGEAMLEHIPKLSIRHEHEEDWTLPLLFAADGTPEGGVDAATVSVPFSSYKTGIFTYDPAEGVYAVSQYNQPYSDGNDGSQVTVTNVIVLNTNCYAYDSEGRMIIDLESGGEGWFACGGKAIPIQWEKGEHHAPLTYTTEDGQPLVLGAGRSYVSIIPLSRAASFE